MRYKLFFASCMMAVAAIGAVPAHANPNPHGNSCQGTQLAGGNTPGNAATSPGSVFNEPPTTIGTQTFPGNSSTGGNGGQAYNAAQANNKVGAAAQYDTACANTLKTGTGTPMQPASANPGTPITNNSINTRNANGVVSHTGNGATK